MSDEPQPQPRKSRLSAQRSTLNVANNNYIISKYISTRRRIVTVFKLSSSFIYALPSLTMPGPGYKKSKAGAKHEDHSRKKEKLGNGSATPDQYIGDIDHAANWMQRVEVLCRVFDIPGLCPLSVVTVITRLLTLLHRHHDA